MRLEIRYYPESELELHPDNMRSAREDKRLKELAASISEQGVIEPLVGVPSGNGNGRITIVVGNRRLQAARLLGRKAPLLPVIVREDLGPLAQLETMAVENLQRVNVDPISEGRHYRRLMDEHGLSVTRIAQRIGKCMAHVKGRVQLLELAPPVQRLIAAGRLPIGAGPHLAAIRDQKVQTDVAMRLADMGMFSLERIAQVVERLQNEKVGKPREGRAGARRSGKTGRQRIAEAMANAQELMTDEGIVMVDGQPISREELNLALQATCAACQVGGLGEGLRWGEVMKAAESTCEGCGLDYLQEACDQCPLVEMLVHLRRLCST